MKIEQTYEAETRALNFQGVPCESAITYIVHDAQDEDQALRAVLGISTKTIGMLEFEKVAVDEKINDTTFRVTASYKTIQANQLEQEDKAPKGAMSFECSGGTKHISHAIEQHHVSGSPNAGRAINWNGKAGDDLQIAGIDIPTASLRETYTRTMKRSRITTDFKRTVAELYGCVNASEFKGWKRGEVMFTGASFSASSDDPKELITVSFNFAIQLNEKNFRMTDDLPAISKEGWEYAWAISDTVTDSGKKPKIKTRGVYIAKVCKHKDFSRLGL